jgi:hypothetical protein
MIYADNPDIGICSKCGWMVWISNAPEVCPECGECAEVKRGEIPHEIKELRARLLGN